MTKVQQNNLIVFAAIGALALGSVAYFSFSKSPEELQLEQIRANIAAYADKEREALNRLREDLAPLRRDVIAEAEGLLADRDHVAAAELLAPWLPADDTTINTLHRVATLSAKAAEDAAAREVAEAKTAAEAEVRRKVAATEARYGKEPVPSGWDGAYYEVERLLKQTANDPSSIDMEPCTKAVPSGDGWRTRCSFRGKNAFGGLVLQTCLFHIRGDSAQLLSCD